MTSPLTPRSLKLHSQALASSCRNLAIVYERYGPPPLWDREPGFATLLQIILEQQVSLASAKACYDKLCQRVGTISPELILRSTDVELKSDGFSRQKTAYARHLAEAVLENRIDFDGLNKLKDADVKSELIKLKGVGEWTSDIYLLMAMLRPDVMPKGDVALHTAWHKLSGEPRPSSDEFLVIAERWKPCRSVGRRPTAVALLPIREEDVLAICDFRFAIRDRPLATSTCSNCLVTSEIANRKSEIANRPTSVLRFFDEDPRRGLRSKQARRCDRPR